MGKSIRIVPAILTDDPATLEKLVRQAETFTDFIQMDIMDGQFVPSHSVACEAIAKLKTTLKWEAHLMVKSPEDCLADFKRAGAQKIVFHYEAVPSPEKTIRAIRKLGMQVGLAINPETSINAIAKLVKQVDSVLFLSVNPGFYGAKFIPEVLDKILAFRKAYRKMEIGIDGGIKESNIVQIARSGVDVICVGSAIFLQPDPAASYRRLTDLAASAAA
ncbi:MAG: ribulose phosphate epimerase [Chloroflexi bacterium RBG_16_50_11]|nr:MAG: ribulose phosphate epimerase [Chloroflexi bacterium RBG_16_50_11]